MFVEKYTEECLLFRGNLLYLNAHLCGSSYHQIQLIMIYSFPASQFEADTWLCYILMYSLHIWLDLTQFVYLGIVLKIKIVQTSPKPCNQQPPSIHLLIFFVTHLPYMWHSTRDWVYDDEKEIYKKWITINKKYLIPQLLKLEYLLLKTYFIWYWSGIQNHTIHDTCL